MHIVDFYLSKLPNGALEKDIFYLRPRPTVPDGPVNPWFDLVPVGKNELAQMVRRMCVDAGIEGMKTNHS